MPDYFRRRWRGQVDGRTLLRRDILLVGTIVNLIVSATALLIWRHDQVSNVWAMVLYFSLVPYNVFLLVCYWSNQQRSIHGSIVSLVWFAAVTIA